MTETTQFFPRCDQDDGVLGAALLALTWQAKNTDSSCLLSLPAPSPPLEIPNMGKWSHCGIGRHLNRDQRILIITKWEEQNAGPRNKASMAANWQWCQSNGVKGRSLQSDKKEQRGEAEEALRLVTGTRGHTYPCHQYGGSFKIKFNTVKIK